MPERVVPAWRRLLRALGWPARFVLIALVRGYQRFISPMFAPSCRYYPCCSAYSVTALRRHGATKGSLLTVARLIRCNPWSRGGVDPVPRRGHWRSPVTPDGRPRRPTSAGSRGSDHGRERHRFDRATKSDGPAGSQRGGADGALDGTAQPGARGAAA